MKNITILLDNGHGFNTPGKRSPDGILREYKYAREVALGIKDILVAKGINVVLITPEENDISLGERVRRANKFGKDALLISIHLNAAGCQGKWENGRGWEAYTSIGQTKADIIAEYFYESARKFLPKDFKIRTDTKSDGDSDKEANFYILKKSICPAILTENLFQDNKEDYEYLLKHQQTIIDLHVDAIINYLKSED